MSNKASIHFVRSTEIFGNISSEQYPQIEIYRENSQNLIELKRVILEKGLNLRRGDFIIITGWGGDVYREPWYYFIYDGNHIINLNYNIDNYGIIPSQFTINEFPIDYWDIETLTNTSREFELYYVVWVPKHMLSEITHMIIDDTHFNFTEFISRGKQYLFIFEEGYPEILPNLVLFRRTSKIHNSITRLYDYKNIYRAIYINDDQY